eukprot:15022245-Alexandrium_andersonii.AAC.1
MRACRAHACAHTHWFRSGPGAPEGAENKTPFPPTAKDAPAEIRITASRSLGLSKSQLAPPGPERTSTAPTGGTPNPGRRSAWA